jgi:hypothetical protein
MANGEVDYTIYKDKAPTKLQARFPDWLIEKVGVTFGTKKEEQAFREGVRLATALRMEFQASPENRAATEQERAERAASKATAPAPEPTPAPAKAAKAAKAAPAAKATPTGRGRGRARPAAAAATADSPF